MSDSPPPPPSPPGGKACPSCAERVQVAARVCRYCGFDFETGAYRSLAADPPGINGLAVASFVLSISWLGGLGSLLAVVFGHKAKSEIDASGGRQSGRGLAVAGLVLGYIGIGLIVLGLLAALFWRFVVYGST